MRVLYVEDNVVDADLARRQLSVTAPWLELDIADTLHAALERLRQPADYDVVLTDKRLPDGDGLTLVSLIREQAMPLAVVMITGVGDQESVVAALRIGADDYVIKRGDYLTILPTTLRTALDVFWRRSAEHTRPLRVLYAEHDRMDVALTRRYLAKCAPHLHVETVSTARDVLDRVGTDASDRRCDVLVLDLHLPDMNALDLLQELRSARATLDLPVVLVTGQGSEEVALQALKTGVTDYLSKNNEGYLSRLPLAIENAYHRVCLEREHAALTHTNRRLRDTLESITEAYFAIDAEERLIEANAVAERTLFGRATDTLLYRPLQECIPTLTDSALHHHLREVAQRQVPAHVEALWPGSERWMEVHAYPRDGCVECYVHDISERKRQERALREANAALEQRAQQLHVLASQLSQVERRERRQLAQVLHDDLQQILVAARMQINTVGFEAMEPATSRVTHKVDELIEQAIEVSRALTAELAPPALYDRGLVAGLGWLAGTMQQRYALQISIRALGDVPAMPESLSEFLLKAVRELLINVAKHAEVKQAEVIVEPLPEGRLRLVVVDEGCGFEPAQSAATEAPRCFGLSNLQERLSMLGGRLEVDSALGKGTRATLVVPVQETSGDETTDVACDQPVLPYTVS